MRVVTARVAHAMLNEMLKELGRPPVEYRPGHAERELEAAMKWGR